MKTKNPTEKSSKKKTQKQKIKEQSIKKIKIAQRKVDKIDLRKIPDKETREYIKRLRLKNKKGLFKKKLTKYLSIAVYEYYSKYTTRPVEELSKAIGISKSTFYRLRKGYKMSVKTYRKFGAFLKNNFNNFETTLLFQISDYLNSHRGKISKKKISEIVNNLSSNFDKINLRLDYYDFLKLYSN